MDPRKRKEKIQQEGRLIIARNALQRDLFQSAPQAADSYFVPQSTLYARIHGRPLRLGERSKFRLLQEHKEEALCSWIYSMEV